MLARHRLRTVPRALWLGFAGVLAIGLVARWVDLGGFGQAWDEDVNWAAGRNYVTNLLSLDFAARSWIWNYEHPPVMMNAEVVRCTVLSRPTAITAPSRKMLGVSR